METLSSNYTRVIPRDFFNESKLLKCMGQLSLNILDGKGLLGLKIEETGEPFEILQDDGDGSLFLSNYKVTFNGKQLFLKSAYNSRLPYPLKCELDDDTCDVFTDNGDFTEEFFSLLLNES